MKNGEDFNLTLPIILIGILAIAVLLFFTLFDKNELGLNTDSANTQTAIAYHFTAPDRVPEGDVAMFSWKADVGESATCEGATVPEGSDGGWSGPKDVSGTQEVGPIEKNTAYYLDCMEGEEVTRDIELVSVVDPKVSFEASDTLVEQGTPASLAWDARYVKGCELSDGEVVLSSEVHGIYETERLEASMSYTLTCKTSKEPLIKTIIINVQ